MILGCWAHVSILQNTRFLHSDLWAISQLPFLFPDKFLPIHVAGFVVISSILQALHFSTPDLITQASYFCLVPDTKVVEDIPTDAWFHSLISPVARRERGIKKSRSTSVSPRQST